MKTFFKNLWCALAHQRYHINTEVRTTDESTLHVHCSYCQNKWSITVNLGES